MQHFFSQLVLICQTYTRVLVSPAAGLAFVVVLMWQAVVSFGLIPHYVLPSPLAIVHSLVDQWELLLTHLQATITISLGGLCIALLLATVSSIVMQWFPQLKRAMYPWLVVSQATPMIFLYPLLLLWFGFGYLPKVIVVCLVCFFPITVNLVDAMARCNPDLLFALQSMGAKPLPTLLRVRFMFALPAYFSGIRLAISYCVVGAVIAEWLGASHGLGVYMLRSYKSFQPDQVFAAIVCIIALTLILLFLLQRLEYFCTPWLRRKT